MVLMSMTDLVKVCKKNIAKTDKNALPNGLICLKGGDMQAELQPFKKYVTLYNLSEFFTEEYFKTKNAVYLPLRSSCPLSLVASRLFLRNVKSLDRRIVESPKRLND